MQLNSGRSRNSARSYMELFTPINHGFSSVLLGVLELWIITCSDEIRFNDKDDKDSKAEAYSKPCKTSKITLFTKIAYYLSS